MESAGAAGFGKGMELAYRGSVGGMELGVGPGDGLVGRERDQCWDFVCKLEGIRKSL